METYVYPKKIESKTTEDEFLEYFNKNYEKCLIDMSVEYPDECSLKLDDSIFVFLNSVEAVDRFSKSVDSQAIANRPQMYALDVISHHFLGSFFRMYDNDLKNVRKTTTNGLHRFVYSNPQAESSVSDELMRFIDFVELNFVRDPEVAMDDVRTYLQQLCVNIVVAFGLDMRFDYAKESEVAVKKICRAMTDILTSANPLVLSKITEANSVTEHRATMEFLKQRLDTIYDFLRETVAKKKQSFDPEAVKTFADLLLSKQNQSSEPGTLYSDEDIIVQLFTVLLAAIGSTGFTLTWALHYLSKNKEVQEKIYAEVRRESGENQVNWELKSKMVYTIGFINEILRLSSIQPLIMRSTMDHETEIKDLYKLPPFTTVLINAFGMHHNPNNWPDNAHECKPERWLDADNKLLSNSKVFLPFGTIPRKCPGKDKVSTG
jgi:cytochrome P450